MDERNGFKEAPNSKLQTPEKLQAPSTNCRMYQFGAWLLVLLWMLELGIWSFFHPA
jgi:hypothetical protein